MVVIWVSARSKTLRGRLSVRVLPSAVQGLKLMENGEADGSGHGTLDPVHGDTLVETVEKAFLLVDNLHCPKYAVHVFGVTCRQSKNGRWEKRTATPKFSTFCQMARIPGTQSTFFSWHRKALESGKRR